MVTYSASIHMTLGSSRLIFYDEALEATIAW